VLELHHLDSYVELFVDGFETKEWHGHTKVQLHGHAINDAMCYAIQALSSVVNACEFDYSPEPFHLCVVAIN
jgi:hypothetical protein